MGNVILYPPDEERNIKARRIPALLEQDIKRYQSAGYETLAEVARKRLKFLLRDTPDDIVIDFRAVVDLYEEYLRARNPGSNGRANHTWKLVVRVGIMRCLETLVSSKKEPSGFRVYEDSGYVEYTYEHVVLDHRDKFSEDVCLSAERRLALVRYIEFTLKDGKRFAFLPSENP